MAFLSDNAASNPFVLACEKVEIVLESYTICTHRGFEVDDKSVSQSR